MICKQKLHESIGTGFCESIAETWQKRLRSHAFPIRDLSIAAAGFAVTASSTYNDCNFPRDKPPLLLIFPFRPQSPVFRALISNGQTTIQLSGAQRGRLETLCRLQRNPVQVSPVTSVHPPRARNNFNELSFYCKCERRKFRFTLPTTTFEITHRHQRTTGLPAFHRVTYELVCEFSSPEAIKSKINNRYATS